jgi:formiminotetrahydrofolate cyclodeaminase
MEGKLTDLSTGKLLEKFGAGNHKPGSGSASALQGMLSAQMLRTVIDLTGEPKRAPTYNAVLPELLRIKSEIDMRIYPALENFFQQDSEVFDKVIQLREVRDKEKDALQKRLLTEKAQQILKPATEIPLKIAELCLELSDFSVYVFNNGFKSARGDAGVALNSALAAIASCLSIIELNLTSIPADDWMEDIIRWKKEIKAEYTNAIPKATTCLGTLEQESENSFAFQQSISEFRKGNLAGTIRDNAELEALVRRLQNTLWTKKDQIWKKDIPDHPMRVLKPEVVLKKVMGYAFEQNGPLGIFAIGGELLEIAGLIDKQQRLVKVSTHFPPETQTFTAAHELGHAILHTQTVLHRDKPLDGSSAAPRSPE